MSGPNFGLSILTSLQMSSQNNINFMSKISRSLSRLRVNTAPSFTRSFAVKYSSSSQRSAVQ